jgi:phytoene dehydrogenase-like protein
MTNPDIIVIGAGHNGLVAATYLAKAGRKVLVLERRDAAGGQLAPLNYGSGFDVEPLHPGARLRVDIARDLDLARHGLNTGGNGPAANYLSALPDGGQLSLSATDEAGSIASIRPHSERDAARWPEFVRYMNTTAAFLDVMQATPMPRLANDDVLAQGRPLASLAWKLRKLGRTDMFRFMRSLSMSAVEFTEEWFESEPLRAALGALAIHGSTLGSMSAGTGYTLLHNWLNRGGLGHPVAAGGSRLVGESLVAAARASGVELRTGAPVARILVDRLQVRGVQLANGEQIAATTVVSDADPRHTLLGLVGAPELPPEFVWQAQSIRMRGSVAKVHVLADSGHGIPDGTVVVAPTLKYLERAFDAAKYAEISQQPYLEVTSQGRVVSIHFQFAPYSLRNSDWESSRSTIERLALDTIASRYPGLRDRIREVRSITPLDLERTWGLTEGDINHGQLILDQLLFMRPIPGWSDHRTPVDGLYLCGSGVHGGGGISGVAGRNAARRVLQLTSRK